MNDGVELRMETVITGVYGDGSVIDNDASGCMESVLFCLNCKNTTGKIFYTSTTSLSHISKVPGNQAAHG